MTSWRGPHAHAPARQNGPPYRQTATMHATGLASPASASTSDPGEPHTGRLPTRCVAVAKPLACPLSFGAPHSGRSRRDFTARQSGGPRQCLPASHLRLTSYPADRLHDKHPPPPASEPSRQPAAEGSGGSILDADPLAQGVKIARRNTVQHRLTLLMVSMDACTKDTPLGAPRRPARLSSLHW